MTYAEIKTMLEGTGIKTFYHHAPDGTKVPFMTYKVSESNFASDNENYQNIKSLTIYFYSKYKDLTSEGLIETVLNDNNLIWRKDSDYNSAEKINYTIYTTEVI